MKSTIFLLVHFSIFGDLDWEGSNGDPIFFFKKTRQNPRHYYEHFIWGGLLLRTGILTYFNSGGFSITVLTLIRLFGNVCVICFPIYIGCDSGLRWIRTEKGVGDFPRRPKRGKNLRRRLVVVCGSFWNWWRMRFPRRSKWTLRSKNNDGPPVTVLVPPVCAASKRWSLLMKLKNLQECTPSDSARWWGSAEWIVSVAANLGSACYWCSGWLTFTTFRARLRVGVHADKYGHAFFRCLAVPSLFQPCSVPPQCKVFSTDVSFEPTENHQLLWLFWLEVGTVGLKVVQDVGYNMQAQWLCMTQHGSACGSPTSARQCWNDCTKWDKVKIVQRCHRFPIRQGRKCWHDLTLISI